MKINNLSPDHNEYIKIVLTIAQSPKRLWYRGNLPQQRRPTVTIVGTRKPTVYGREVTTMLASQLAKRGVVVVSGLALGIDAIAHKAALDAGGTTIAVLPCGLDRIYPRTNANLAEDIVNSGGALISEYEPGAPIYPVNFVARNRIAAGISDAVVIVEASAKSGTMHTASFALEQGKEVLAVPGNITSMASEGCNNLIKTGARPITVVGDVLDALGVSDTAQQTVLPLGTNREEQAILDLLIKGVRRGEELQAQSGLQAALFGQTMTMLEINGSIKPLGANRWALK